jgi:hypothetical protein
LRRVLRGKGSLWIYAPGFFNESGSSIAGISEILGMEVGILEREMPLEVVTGRPIHPSMTSVTPGTRYGIHVEKDYISRALNYPVKREIGPIFYVNDPRVIELGKIEGTEKTGLCLVSEDRTLRVYSSAPAVSADIIRGIAKHLGVHCYLESSDLVYANENFLAIYAFTSGLKSIRLPFISRVQDVYENRLLAEGTDRLDLRMRFNSTVMLKVERV